MNHTDVFCSSYTVSSLSSLHYISSVSCGIREQRSIAARFVVLLVLEGFSLTGGHHFVHLSVQKGPLGASGPGRLCQGCGRTEAAGGGGGAVPRRSPGQWTS
ncbi:hypothetical protein PBY51_009356 [Eleginops maclovinus]|uniref:Uncharacterized protein n=1 Tax=Eleginops maclovinus TaxID=56733 RepID=A0AAN7XWK0_ELEMC|nr:hypothetical protein PBY51_009356 [Eleginops maclovinus]